MFEAVQSPEHFRGAIPEGEGCFFPPAGPVGRSSLHWFLRSAGWSTWFSETRASRGALELNSWSVRSFPTVCHSSHQWGAFVQRNVFKWLLNAAQGLHQDLMSSSPPGWCNRCVEASIEPFVTLNNLLPSRFIRTVTIQPSSCASLASADCFPSSCPCLCSNNSFTLS